MKRRTRARLASLFDTLRANGWEPGGAAGWDAAGCERNYAVLCESRTSSHNLAFACVAIELLAANQPDTVRGNMYQVVTHGWLPDTGRKSYDRIQRLLNRLRLRGTIPFEWVVDNVRSTIKPSSWTGLADFAETVRDAYRKDFWAQLPVCVEVIVEKDTIAGKLEPVTREYDVALHPLRGYSSTSFAFSIARSWRRVEKPIVVYYVGDHDPSGRDLEREVREKIGRMLGREGVDWRRLAVNLEHFEEFGIVPLAVKKTDTRYRKFVEAFGPRCAEAEAVPAAALRAMLRRAIESHIPSGQWQRLKEIERLERERWQEVMAFLDPESG